MLNKSNSFCSYTMTKILILISTYYAFCRQPNILDYIADLLKKDKIFYNNIKNISNKRYYHRDFAYKLRNYIQV